MTIKALNSRIVYQNQWMTVREDVIERADGSSGLYGVVEKPDFVIILPIEQQHIYLVEQFRYPVQQRFWEFPQGSWEHQPNSDPAIVAQGELEEETGLRANQMTYLGYLYGAYGYANQGMHVFLATGLVAGSQQLSVEEQDLVMTKMTLSQFESMVQEGQIKDAATLAAYTLFKIKYQ